MAIELDLVREKKLYKLLPGRTKKSPLEASGVVAVGPSTCYIIFDSLNAVGKVNTSLKASKSNRLIPVLSPGTGFEDIAFDPRKGRFFLIVESIEDTDGKYRALVVEYDRDFRFQRCSRLSTTFKSSNKGFEGVAHLWHGSKEYLLAMCEGNLCTDAKKGGGRVQVFVRTKEGDWKWSHKVDLPRSAEFEDYASIAVLGNYVVVVSQASQRMWVGMLNPSGKGFAKGTGRVFRFPSKSYCNVEGVSYLGNRHVVTVSDRRKKSKQPKCCADKDQSIHVFKLPPRKSRS